MTGLDEIESALNQRLTMLQGLPDVAWPNMPFKPTMGSPYFRPSLIPGEPIQAGVGTDAMNEQTGIYQVTVFVPAGTGTQQLRGICKELEAHFKRGIELTYGAVAVKIRKSFRGPNMQEPDWLSCPFSIAFYAYTAN